MASVPLAGFDEKKHIQESQQAACYLWSHYLLSLTGRDVDDSYP